MLPMEKSTYLIEVSGSVEDRLHRNLPFQTETGPRKDHILEVIADRAEGVCLEHVPDQATLFPGFLAIHFPDEADAFADRQISPVDALFGVDIVGVK